LLTHLGGHSNSIIVFIAIGLVLVPVGGTGANGQTQDEKTNVENVGHERGTGVARAISVVDWEVVSVGVSTDISSVSVLDVVNGLNICGGWSLIDLIDIFELIISELIIITSIERSSLGVIDFHDHDGVLCEHTSHWECTVQELLEQGQVTIQSHEEGLSKLLSLLLVLWTVNGLLVLLKLVEIEIDISKSHVV